jgi:hypothetical protein
MSNDFTYNISEINEEEIFKGWEEMVAEDGSIWETGYDDDADHIDGYDDGEWLDDLQGEEEFA